MSKFWTQVTKMAFAASQPTPPWPALTHRQTIPAGAQSAHKPNQMPSVVSLSMVKAVTDILTGDATYSQDARAFTVRYRSSSKGSSSVRYMTVRRDPSGVTFIGESGRTGPYALLIAAATQWGVPELQEVAERWWHLIETLGAEVGARTAQAPAFTDAELRRASNCAKASFRMTALLDSLYYCAQGLVDQGQLGHEDIMAKPGGTPLDTHVFTVHPAAPSAPASAPVDATSPAAHLMRAARRGGRVLLVGPTGTFKTESAKRAAVHLGRPLYVVKGNPEVEPTDFLGGYQMVDGKPEWVDGPFTQAFVTAQTRGVVLLIDELLRFDPINLSSLVGVLDHVSAPEAALMGVPGLPDGRYYVLRLKNGELVWAPVAQVLLVATTNIGDAYLQAAQSVDAALLGRFTQILEMTYADADQACALYAQCGHPRLAAAVYAVELETREAHVSRGGLLEREANPRVILSWVDATLDLHADGLSLMDALRVAAETTLLPFCVGRDYHGTLDQAAAADLRRVVDVQAISL